MVVHVATNTAHKYQHYDKDTSRNRESNGDSIITFSGTFCRQHFEWIFLSYSCTYVPLDVVIRVVLVRIVGSVVSLG